MRVSETDVLKPVDPTITDEDEWPQFTLSSAEVFDQPADGESIVSLLVAGDARPLRIHGKLERLPKKQNQYLRKTSTNGPLQISLSNVQHFAYGQYDSGEIAFWAAGQAGWFEIAPSKRYSAIYEGMIEAIGILYFVADLYRERGRNRGRATAIDTIMEKYASDPDNDCADVVVANARFRKYKDVLLALMEQGKEGVAWQRTPIYKHLQKTSANTYTPRSARNADETTDPDDDDNDSMPARLAGKGKSSLRPTSGKHSNKSAKRKRNEANFDDNEEDEDSMTPTPSKSNGSKRMSEEVDDARTQRLAKRHRLIIDLESEDEPVADEVEDRMGEDDEESDYEEEVRETNAQSMTNLPLRDTNARPTTRRPNQHDPVLSLVSRPLYSTQPNTTRKGVWCCQYDGCNREVYDASTEDSQDLIKEHLRSHAEETQKKLDLIQREERPYLPVGNLIQRIRDMTKEANKSSDSATKSDSDRSNTSLAARIGIGVDGRDPWDTRAIPKPISQRY